MQTGSYEVHKLLKLIKENKFRIPHFQRDFRWSCAQIKLLVDSMARNYPIGSLLMMAKSPEFNFQSRSIAAEISSDIEASSLFLIKTEDDLADNNILYVLDGQQRLTSVARVFLNSDPDKAFYFDLHEIVKDFINNNDESTSWIKVFRKHSIEKDTDRRENNRLVRADIVMLDDVKSGVYISEYVEDSGEFPEWANDKTRQRQEIAKVNRVFEKLRKYTIPIVFLEQDIGIESICRVFETINSTGMRLTTFDLAVAKFYPKKLDLRAKWEEAQSTHPILANFQVDGERVLQILVLRLSEESNQALEVNRRTLLEGLKDEYIEKNWDEAIKALVRAYEWAKSMGACPGTLTNHALLVAIGAHWCARPRLEPNHLLLMRWFFSHLLQNVINQATNYRIGRYFKELKELAIGKKGRDIIPKVSLTPEKLLGLTRDNRFKAMQCILFAAVNQDLKTGFSLKDKEDIEDHHIYPKSYCKNVNLDKKLCDSIVNRIAISKETNRSLGNKPPERYFSDIVEEAQKDGTVEGLKSRLKSCFIPNSSLKNINKFKEQFAPDQFHAFMNARAKLLWEEIHRVIGDSLVTEEPQGEDEED